MDARLRTFAWILGSGCFGAMVGIVFGALAGALYWRSGRASGTRLGLLIADAFGRFSRRPLSRTTRGSLIGAVDGLLFLGVVGTLLGVAGVASGRDLEEILRPALWLALLLVGGAIFFGTLAYTLTRAGVRALAAVGGGGILGAALGSYLAGVGGLLFGSLGGLVAGNALGLLWPARYEPEFLEPQLTRGAARLAPGRRRRLPTTGGIEMIRRTARMVLPTRGRHGSYQGNTVVGRPSQAVRGGADGLGRPSYNSVTQASLFLNHATSPMRQRG